MKFGARQCFHRCLSVHGGSAFKGVYIQRVSAYRGLHLGDGDFPQRGFASRGVCLWGSAYGGGLAQGDGQNPGTRKAGSTHPTGMLSHKQY